jgi:hypothetical protein
VVVVVAVQEVQGLVPEQERVRVPGRPPLSLQVQPASFPGLMDIPSE